jgi:hypothetical protein
VPKSSPDPLLTARARVILLLAVMVGAGAGGLSYLTHRSFPGAVLIGDSATGGAILLFNSVIGR